MSLALGRVGHGDRPLPCRSVTDLFRTFWATIAPPVASISRVVKWPGPATISGKEVMASTMRCAAATRSASRPEPSRDLHDKDVVAALRGKWFVEMAELVGLRRYEVESM